MYLEFLKACTDKMIYEWVRRGYRNNLELYVISGKFIFSAWIGLTPFYAFHRSNLLRKALEYYSQFGWEKNKFTLYMVS